VPEDPDPARTPAQLFAAWRPRARSGPSSRAPEPLPALLPSSAFAVRPAAAADLSAVAAVAAARNGNPVPEELAVFERRLVSGPLPALPMVWVAELGEGGPTSRLPAYGTLFHMDDAVRRAMATDLGLDPDEPHDPSRPGSLVPAGWYLGGLVVDPPFRRLGLGRALTAARLTALDAAGVLEVRYLANATNRATLALHEPFGFELEAEDPAMGGVAFTGGRGHLLVRRSRLSP